MSIKPSKRAELAILRDWNKTDLIVENIIVINLEHNSLGMMTLNLICVKWVTI